MNNITNRDYELYNNVNYTSDYNTGLINPKINTFFNDVLNKPDPVYPNVIKSEHTWNKFYKNYIEHNILFFIILIGIVIFLIIRHYTKDLDHDKIKNKNEFDSDTDDDLDDLDDLDDKQVIRKKLKKKYRTKLKKYKKELYEEKQKILNIIDELSELNYEDKTYNEYVRDNYEKQINQLETQRKQDNIEQHRQLEELRQLGNMIQAKKSDVMNFQPNKTKEKTKEKINKNPLDHTIKNFDTDTDQDDNRSNFYNIKKYDKQNKDNYINGLYIETPFD
jgi:hypothetical protein